MGAMKSSSRGAAVFVTETSAMRRTSVFVTKMGAMISTSRGMSVFALLPGVCPCLPMVVCPCPGILLLKKM